MFFAKLDHADAGLNKFSDEAFEFIDGITAIDQHAKPNAVEALAACPANVARLFQNIETIAHRFAARREFGVHKLAELLEAAERLFGSLETRRTDIPRVGANSFRLGGDGSTNVAASVTGGLSVGGRNSRGGFGQ